MMTKTEYEQYEASVKAFFEREGLNCLTADSNDDGKRDEPFFSHSRCDVCDRPEGGDRVDMSGFNPTTRQVQAGYRVCVDCQYYVEYGQLDDMTMLDMEREAGK